MVYRLRDFFSEVATGEKINMANNMIKTVQICRKEVEMLNFKLTTLAPKEANISTPETIIMLMYRFPPKVPNSKRMSLYVIEVAVQMKT